MPLTLKNFNQTTPPRSPLCFTANTANSTVALIKKNNPTSVTLETSTDGNTWSTYTFGSTITLSNIGDKVYFRNTSETDTGFTPNTYDYYNFSMSGSIAGRGDTTSLLNKNGTDTVSGYCFLMLFFNCTALTTAPSLPATTIATHCYYDMFNGCSSLTTAPSLPATTLYNYCYYEMFYNCSSLEELPILPATTLKQECYRYMFSGCSNIKISETQTGEYQTAYRIPTTGTGTTADNALYRMFYKTGGTYATSAVINTTYYTSNTVV